jgi:hypothetical protein
LVVGFPLLLVIIWFAGQDRHSATAEVSIDSDKVSRLRGETLLRLGAVGATKISEDTAYGEGGHSELRFRIPPARLEEALSELNVVGGKVTSQRVEVEELSEQADAISSGLDGVTGCLSDLAGEVGSGSSANSELAACRDQLDAVGKQLDASPQAAQDAILVVRIAEPDTTNMAVIVAVVLLAVALGVMAFMTFRSTHHEPVVDVTDRTKIPERDLHEHRKWN